MGGGRGEFLGQKFAEPNIQRHVFEPGPGNLFGSLAADFEHANGKTQGRKTADKIFGGSLVDFRRLAVLYFLGFVTEWNCDLLFSD